jgi:hypothetical protein
MLGTRKNTMATQMEMNGKSILTGMTSMEECMAVAWLEDKVTNEEPDAHEAEQVLRILNALNGTVRTLLNNN